MSLRNTLAKILSDWPAAKTQRFTQHPIATFFRQEFKQEIERIVKDFDGSYLTVPSVGAGNWADVAWLSILNPAITKTTQDGIYPVYLFQADGAGVFLSLIQGTTAPTQKLGKKPAEAQAERVKESIFNTLPELYHWGRRNITLNTNTNLGKSYEKFNIFARYYAADNLPDDATLEKDLQEMLTFYRQIAPIYLKETQTAMKPTAANAPPPPSPSCIPLPKPFVLLAGISGTGKSRFVREQAMATGGPSMDNYCLVSVRPDWHEPSDLLGYTTRLSGAAHYVATDTLRFIVTAWKALVDQGIKIESINGRPVATGQRPALDAAAPYWLCLDEMNLAPVEQYFADYLSVIETRRWQWDGDSFVYSCDALLKSSHLQELDAPEQLRENLGLAAEKYNDLWEHFLDDGISIPLNLLVAGTVNMDETTHGFSRKVIDRALTLDFGEFFPNDLDRFFQGGFTHEVLSYPNLSDARNVDYFGAADPDGKMTIEFLKAINAPLIGTPFELAYRTLNELLLAVACQQPQDTVTLQAVWDDVLMQKMLPRIDGDAEKLRQTFDNDSLLSNLYSAVATQLVDIWTADGVNSTRPDFYRSGALTACRSQQKLEWMQQRLNDAGFTSFWP
ncbi:DUF3578 domain-containing protein [Halomonas piscis]|uniref:DUF3578 domain-containing protein n=1 Tax=Halomonas piscis TaxID=3031727 RepID=A0ABY9Z0S9_9GAMM|nr:DUF3578 domain-containing protein [Halomonas piscis]WNK20632.1 DUF3578 domain-containing protein [Halomonas piscis]